MALCKQLSNTTLDCSNLKLSVIPKNIPKTVLRLNLSGNHLENLEDDSFDECCEKLKVLDISNNQLTTLTQRHFGRLKSLETLLLGSNKITDLQPDTFEAVTSLRRLDLSRNEIKLNDMPSSGFLIQPTIKELNLDYCGIREFPDDTFAGVAQLRNLTLAGNPIDENMDVTAFQALEHLYKLRIPNLSKTAIYLICEKLVSIDVINFDEFNVSCTVLSDDEAFEEAVIANDKVGEPEIASVILPTTTTRIATLTSTTEAPSSLNTTESVVLDSNSISPYIIETSDDTNKTRIDTAETRVDIDNETIKFILLGSRTRFIILIALLIFNCRNLCCDCLRDYNWTLLSC